MQKFNITSIERALLSAIFYDANTFNDIESELEYSDFSYKGYSDIFLAMVDLNRLDMPITEEFIHKKLSKLQNIEHDIVEIIATAPIVDIKSYVKLVKDYSLKRKLHTLANHIHQKSLDDNLSSDDIINDVESAIFKLQTKSFNVDFQNYKDVLNDEITKLKELKEQGNRYFLGIDTGFVELNRFTKGFKGGELIIIAARPGMGKTALALNMATQTLKNNQGVVFFSLEMDAGQIVLRIASSIASIPLQRLRIGDLDDKEWNYFQNICNETSKWKLYIDDSGGLDIYHLRSKLRKLKLQDSSISLAIVDYLQIMSGSNNQDRHLQIAEISRGLKILARELNIPIIALSQLNRSLESRGDRRPTLSDLRESGSIEQDADIILFIYRDDIYKRRDAKEKIGQARKEGKEVKVIPQEEPIKDIEVAELIIGKHRNGPIGTIKLMLHIQYTKFSGIENNQIEQKDTKMEDVFDMPTS